MINLHTHCTYCDGRDTPEAMAQAALDKGFAVLGFTSHAMGATTDGCALPPERYPAYVAEVRALAARYAGRLRILCGFEADYVPGIAVPDRATYAAYAPDYLIGSVHYVPTGDGGLGVAVDDTPERLAQGIREHFGGDARRCIVRYFAQVREMVRSFDFDIVGHPDLPRKFNQRHPYFDEEADWYVAELEATADVIAVSGKVVEINTGAIARGWLDDAYPSAAFRRMLAVRGVPMLVSSDAHTAAGLDCAFDRFVTPETEACVRAFVASRPVLKVSVV